MNLLMGIMILGSMLLLSLRFSGVYSPSSLMLAIWFLDFLAQYSFGFYVIELKTIMLLTIFISYFSMGAFFGSSVKFKKSTYEWSENKIYNAIKLIFMLLVIVAPFLYLDIRDNVGFDVDNFTRLVRTYYITAENTPITIKIAANFSIILVVLLFVHANIKFPIKFVLIMFALLSVTATFSKGYFLLMLCYIFSVKIFQNKRLYSYPHLTYYEKNNNQNRQLQNQKMNKVNGLCKLNTMKPKSFKTERKRKMGLSLIVTVLSALLVLILSAVVRDNLDIGTYFRIYFLSSVPAFQMIVNDEFYFSFPTILGFMKPVYESFGMNIGAIISNNFVEVPDYTNVFTAFGPAFSDYGFLFTVLYFMVNGFISGIVFKLAKLNYMVFKILYGFVLFAIVTSVFSDAFALWSTIFNYSLVFLIIHLYARTKIENRSLTAV